MKRKKLADMSELELGRYRLLQARRTCRRMTNLLNTIKEPQRLPVADQATIRWNTDFAGSVIAITKPSWVAKASTDDVAAVLQHIAGVQN